MKVTLTLDDIQFPFEQVLKLIRDQRICTVPNLLKIEFQYRIHPGQIPDEGKPDILSYTLKDVDIIDLTVAQAMGLKREL